MGNNKEKEQFVQTGFELLDNDSFLVKHRSKYVLYLLMRRYVVRKPHDGDLDLHKKYWRNGMLVCSKPLNLFARKFGYKKCKSKKTGKYYYAHSQIRKWIEELKTDRMVKINHVDVGKQYDQWVYILGCHNSLSEKEYKEYYYVDNQTIYYEDPNKTMIELYHNSVE